MSNLEHVFELTLSAIEKGLDRDEWLTMMNKSNCAGNAKGVGFMFRDNSPNLEFFAKLHDGRRIWLNDIWELAQYTYPLTVMIKDLKEE